MVKDIKKKGEKCPHLNCLVYHPDGVCTCDMSRYCPECKKPQPLGDTWDDKVTGEIPLGDKRGWGNWSKEFDKMTMVGTLPFIDYSKPLCPKCSLKHKYREVDKQKLKSFIRSLVAKTKKDLLSEVCMEIASFSPLSIKKTEELLKIIEKL